MALRSSALALAGALAATATFAAPVEAAALSPAPLTPQSVTSGFDFSRFDAAADAADWRCRGWGCGGWRGHRGWRRNRVDAGDVLIGAAIIGGAIAIANANKRRTRTEDVVVVRDDDWRDDSRRYDDRRTRRRSTGSTGLDSAVDQCVARIERDVRVDSVDSVERNGHGWQVSGALFDGSPFQCRIGNDGRIEGVDFGGGFARGGDWGAASDVSDTPRGDGQWSDARYADARLAMGGMAQPQARVAGDYYGDENLIPPTTDAERAASAAQLMPAYPGGPIPGEEIPETIDGDIGG
ncbi:MAG: hypothetical protein GC147_02155 [Porphyrobacter sp.]|nr:hypothetical protein [Porphyrobacter sp.]